MSHVADVTMLLAYYEDCAIAEALVEPRSDRPLFSRGAINTDNAGGGKVYCTDIYAAACNYLNIPALLRQVRDADWKGPWVLIVEDEQDDPTVYFGGPPLAATGVTVGDLEADSQPLPWETSV